MNSSQDPTTDTKLLTEAARRKRLGQYYTGTELGRLLAALAETEAVSSAIDPMAGTGDLLAACVELGVKPNVLGAVEIDPIAYKKCTSRIPEATCVLGNAFDPAIISRLPKLQWELVITNPPYVRYQSMARRGGKEFALPNMTDVRSGLLDALEVIPFPDQFDRVMFRKLAVGYPGLADLAVPSWILCAALVAPGGTLALVVPESWLTRDYAAVVRYMLLRWFTIEFIVEDEHAAWFTDAQVKTNLLIARRTTDKESAFDYAPEETFLKLRLSGQAKGSSSIVEHMYPLESHKERHFAEEARKWLSIGTGYKGDLVEAVHVPFLREAKNVLGICRKQKWFSAVGDSLPTTSHASDSPSIPNELVDYLRTSGEIRRLLSLNSIGVHVGQGLRTGANAFFYVDVINESDETAVILPNDVLSLGPTEVPRNCILPVLRNQSELPEGYVIHATNLSGRVLALQKLALPEDIKKGGHAAKTAYAVMANGLANLVKTALKTNFGTPKRPKSILEYTAVQPNIRNGNIQKGLPSRYWYMLPDFARRHRPDLCIPRINNAKPKAFLNSGRSTLVDANFSTLWLDKSSRLDVYALLALLNSSWCCAAMELSTSVMGGGALKVEATHLRRLPVPNLSVSQSQELADLGHKLASSDETVDHEDMLWQIDVVVTTALLGRPASEADIQGLRQFVTEGVHRRSKQNSKGKK